MYLYYVHNIGLKKFKSLTYQNNVFKKKITLCWVFGSITFYCVDFLKWNFHVINLNHFWLRKCNLLGIYNFTNITLLRFSMTGDNTFFTIESLSVSKAWLVRYLSSIRWLACVLSLMTIINCSNSCFSKLYSPQNVDKLSPKNRYVYQTNDFVPSKFSQRFIW